MTKREEIIQEYHCYDSHGELCCDCDECKKALADDLDDFESEIRAEERRKFAEWLINSKYHGICNEGFMYGVSDLHFKFNISSIDEILAEYEKEQK